MGANAYASRHPNRPRPNNPNPSQTTSRLWLQLAAPAVVTHYELVVANDAPYRDAVSWQFGILRPIGAFELLIEVQGATPPCETCRFERYEQTFDARWPPPPPLSPPPPAPPPSEPDPPAPPIPPLSPPPPPPPPPPPSPPASDVYQLVIMRVRRCDDGVQKSSPCEDGTQLSEVQLFDVDVRLFRIEPPAGVSRSGLTFWLVRWQGEQLVPSIVTSPDGVSPSSQGPAMLADNSSSTKWFSSNTTWPQRLVFTFNASQRVDNLVLVTANDNPRRAAG